ncbi:MAG: hypothetical protein KBT08_08640 [Bacteroidales bacterium]|nr:hypothetical protein [Candidatus Cryptobacteroides onthequi]
MRNQLILSAITVILLASCQEESIEPNNSMLREEMAMAIATKSDYEQSSEIAIEAFPHVEKTPVMLPSGVLVAQMDSLYILQGDIVLSGEQLNQLAYPQIERAAITSDFVKYWPNHTVYYTYRQGFSGSNEVQSAISEWENKTGLDFVYGTGRGNYIEFSNNFEGSYYSSSIGMSGGRQIISLYYNQIEPGVVMHEIGHAIGLFHEHCRADRDNYITICTENIIDGGIPQFEKNTFAQERTIGPFDFGSIMLYNSSQGSRNGLPTMLNVNGFPFTAQIDSLSYWDAETVKAIYGPPYHKLVCDVTDSYYQDYGTSEQWSEQCEYSIKIYSDKNYTIPASLQYYRKVKVRHTIESIEYGNVESYNEDTVHIIPTGTSEYHLGSGYTYMHSDYGEEFGRREYYTILY